MDTSEIQARIDVLPAKMATKGLIRPEVEYSLKSNSEPNCYIKWYEVDGMGRSDSEYEFFKGKDFFEILNKVEAYIDSMPSAEEIKRRAFIAALIKIADYGKTLGQDVGFLVSEMRRISSNALTDQREEGR